MSRLFRSLSLLVLISAGTSLGRAADADYFLPVTYDMVISRSVTKTDTAAKLQTTLNYELFNTRDLLREVLKSYDITNLANWSLVARGNTGAFSDPHATDTLSSLEIVVRNKKTKEIKTIPADLAIGFSQIYSACAFSRSERQDVDTAADPDTYTPVSGSTTLSRVAELTQKLKARGTFPAGTLVATGKVDYTNVYNIVTTGGQSTEEAVLRPTRATFRAVGSYIDGAGDGIVELRLLLGTPTYVVTSTPD